MSYIKMLLIIIISFINTNFTNNPDVEYTKPIPEIKEIVHDDKLLHDLCDFIIFLKDEFLSTDYENIKLNFNIIKIFFKIIESMPYLINRITYISIFATIIRICYNLYTIYIPEYYDLICKKYNEYKPNRNKSNVVTEENKIFLTL